jgi:hypothetical protein
MKLRIVTLGVLSAAILASACTDPIHIQASDVVSIDTLTVSALSGTSPSLPSSVDLFTRQPVVVDGSAQFDVAFDIVSATKVRVIPVKLVVTSISGVRLVGLKTAPGKFDSLLLAPTGTYQQDSSLTVSPGDLVVFQTTRSLSGEFCQFAISPYLYAKLSVISIDMTARTIQFQLGTDPNCGFRSLQPGLPTS